MAMVIDKAAVKAPSPLMAANRATREERVGRWLTRACIAIIVALVAGILVFVTARGLTTFTRDHVNLWRFLTNANWTPSAVVAGVPQAGAAALIFTSFAVTGLAALAVTPFALAVAIYRSEYAGGRARRVLEATLELLVGIPSVVYGYLGLVLVVPAVRRLGGSGFGILAGMVVLAIMILPTVAALATSALTAIPLDYRQASLALGATRWQTTWRVVMRAATPGLLTAIIFGMARAFGEALAVQMVIGNAALMPRNLLTPAATLTSELTTQIGNTVMGTPANDALWSLALVLMMMALAFNLLVRWLASREVKK